MFTWYVPEALYERLPLVYVLLALAVALVPSPLALAKWAAVGSLLGAAVVTRLLRGRHRRDAVAARIARRELVDETVYVIE